MRKTMQRLARNAETVATALLLLLASPAFAEVGVVYPTGQGSAAQGPYEFSTIIEDGDPVGIRWRPYSPPGSNRLVLNPEGESNGDGKPSSLFNSYSQLPIVTWAKSTPTGFDVVLSYFTSGAWTNPIVLCENATTTMDAEPNLVMNPTDGSVHLLYWTDESSPKVMHMQAPADLSSWSDPVQVSEMGAIALRPCGAFHQGVLKIVYESHAGVLGGTPRYMMLATENGGGYIREVLATTNYADPNRPRIHGAFDKLWVDWIDDEGEMTWKRQVLPGPWEPVELEFYSTTEERDYHVRGEIKGLALVE